MKIIKGFSDFLFEQGGFGAITKSTQAAPKKSTETKAASTPAAPAEPAAPASGAAELAKIKTECDKISTEISKWVEDLYKNSNFWTSWKGGLNDDEAGAWKDGFCSQWEIDITPKLTELKATKTKLEGLSAAGQSLAGNADATGYLTKITKNIDVFNDMRNSDRDDGLYDCTLGSNDTDVFGWTIQLSTGFKSYSVDTDF